jgi:hypothetical protein
MSEPRVTIRHDRDTWTEQRTCAAPVEHGIGIHCEVTYTPDQAMEALEAVAAMAADLARQIADAAETRPQEDQ